MKLKTLIFEYIVNNNLENLLITNYFLNNEYINWKNKTLEKFNSYH